MLQKLIEIDNEFIKTQEEQDRLNKCLTQKEQNIEILINKNKKLRGELYRTNKKLKSLLKIVDSIKPTITNHFDRLKIVKQIIEETRKQINKVYIENKEG